MTLRASIPWIALAFLLPAPAAAQRLSAGVAPEHYDLRFTIDLAHARFAGQTAIDIRLSQPTSRIQLHAVELDIESASITAVGRTQTASVAANAHDETISLTVPAVLPAGPARIEITYRAALNRKLRGLYLSQGASRSYAVTQFESTDARRAFPCFDEPAYKATFALTIVADRGDVAISNGRLVSDTPGPTPSQHTMTFSRTARMSSYLVAMAVGDFQCLEGGADGVPIRICTTPDKKELGRIALDYAQQILAYLNRYHTIKYPFEKLDVVAVPDFAAGAMENTAAIFYRETDLLADSAAASLGTRKTIFGVLAHEMAHQWFGDLVTMQWWDDLWLNESFATWMANRPAAALMPDWHVEVSDAQEIQAALSLDSLEATHPIHVTVNTPDEIESVFDPISYEKGASVLRMLESYVGEEAFHRGVNAYLERHKYANATSEDFFAAISAASGKPVERVMGTFVLQEGVPLVEADASCTNNRMAVTLRQRRFTLAEAPAAGRERWQIPICLKTAAGSPAACSVFDQPTETVQVGSACAAWVFANAGGKGYYRTAYKPDALKALARDAERMLSAPERLSLVSDEWALVRAGRDSVDHYLDVAVGFGSERIAPVLEAIVDRLETIDDYFTTPATRPAFRRFVQSLLEGAYRSIGFDRRPNDSEDDRLLRSVVIGALGDIANDADVAARARTAVTAALKGEAPLDPILAGTLVSTAAAHGDAALFDLMQRAALSTVDPQQRYRYLYALADFEDPVLVGRALDLALRPELRSQDTALYLAGFFANESARDRAWSFVKAHWQELEPKVVIAGGDTRLVSSLSSFCSADAKRDITAFFAAHPLPTAERTLRQTTERIDNCIATRAKQQQPLAEWLRSR